MGKISGGLKVTDIVPNAYEQGVNIYVLSDDDAPTDYADACAL